MSGDELTRRLKLSAAKDVLDRNGLKAKEELVLHTALDATKFADWDDHDLELFISLARRASMLHEVNERPHAAARPTES